jgi:hypothetical protein
LRDLLVHLEITKSVGLRFKAQTDRRNALMERTDVTVAKHFSVRNFATLDFHKGTTPIVHMQIIEISVTKGIFAR